jgi:hypothetical protein
MVGKCVITPIHFIKLRISMSSDTYAECAPCLQDLKFVRLSRTPNRDRDGNALFTPLSTWTPCVRQVCIDFAS